MIRYRTIRRGVNELAMVSLASSLAFASPALAQDASTPPEVPPAPSAPQADGESGAEIVVTGSRIRRTELEEPNPIQSFSSEDMQLSGKTNVTEFLLDTPALAGSLGSERTGGSNIFANIQGAGLNLLNLRNLGEDRTLVLVNGRRHVAGLPGISGVDINSIPSALIEKVDVLTGGVSAIYGADGVSGVVNFILKRDFEGLLASGQIGLSEHGDAGRRDASILAGANFADGRGNVTLSYDYSSSDRLSQFDRSFSGNMFRTFTVVDNPGDPDDDPRIPDRIALPDVRYAQSSPDGGIDVDFDGIADFTGSGGVYDHGRLLSDGLVQGGSGTPLAGYSGDFLPSIEQHNVNLLTGFEFSPAFRLFLEGKYATSRTFTAAQPTFDVATILASDNAFLNARFGDLAPDGALMTRDNFDLGVAQDKSDRKTIRAVIGAEGKLGDHLRYEVAYVYGRTKADTLKMNNRYTDRYFAALDAVVDPGSGRIMCRSDLTPGENIDPNNYDGPARSFTPGPNSGCVPLDLLGEGVADPAAIDFIMARSRIRSQITQQVISGSLSGDSGGVFSLPGGPVGFALGAEYRKESSRSVPSPELQDGQVFDVGPYSADSGSFDVKEVFGEINVPLLKDVPFAKTLSFGAALRLSDYSTVGSTTAWKFDAVYAPIEDIAFRATYSKVVRAPNIAELFAGRSSTFTGIEDPCDPSRQTSGSQFRAANCVAVLQALGFTQGQIDAFAPDDDVLAGVARRANRQGNPDLKEETAKTWTAGLVFRPRFVPGLTASADWYDINLKNAISRPSGQDVVALCVDQPTIDNVYCDAVTRNPGDGFVSSVFLTPQNVANFRTAGLDVSVNYRFNPGTDLGTFNLKLVGGYLHRLAFIATPDAAVNSNVNEIYAPRYVGSADLTWSRGAVSINYGLGWHSRVDRFNDEERAANPDIAGPELRRYKERWEHDIQLSVDVDSRFTFFGGVNNFTDEKPGFASESYPVSAVGRYYYLGAKAKLR